MSSTPDEHRAEGPQVVRCVIVTISDTRTLESDRGGAEIVNRLSQAGHVVVLRTIIPDEPDRIRDVLIQARDNADVDAVLLTGGTGITHRDQTYETVSAALTKPLPGYGELFRMLSYDEIGAATMLSRTVGGLMDRTIVLTMPGSTAAVRLAMEKIIVPELGHLVREARR